jgi:hypothetical protein
VCPKWQDVSEGSDEDEGVCPRLNAFIFLYVDKGISREVKVWLVLAMGFPQLMESPGKGTGFLFKGIYSLSHLSRPSK